MSRHQNWLIRPQLVLANCWWNQSKMPAASATESLPGGTTVAALRELEESGIRGAFYRAIDKCVERTRSMN